MNKSHQVKSKFYYIFWGTATVSVLAGQLYVGAGYKTMAQSIKLAIDVIESVREDSRIGDGNCTK